MTPHWSGPPPRECRPHNRTQPRHSLLLHCPREDFSCSVNLMVFLLRSLQAPRLSPRQTHNVACEIKTSFSELCLGPTSLVASLPQPPGVSQSRRAVPRFSAFALGTRINDPVCPDTSCWLLWRLWDDQHHTLFLFLVPHAVHTRQFSKIHRVLFYLIQTGIQIYTKGTKLLVSEALQDQCVPGRMPATTCLFGSLTEISSYTMFFLEILIMYM